MSKHNLFSAIHLILATAVTAISPCINQTNPTPLLLVSGLFWSCSSLWMLLVYYGMAQIPLKKNNASGLLWDGSTSFKKNNASGLFWDGSTSFKKKECFWFILGWLNFLFFQNMCIFQPYSAENPSFSSKFWRATAVISSTNNYSLGQAISP